jgi:phospholipase/lecithinase/hemolysin
MSSHKLYRWIALAFALALTALAQAQGCNNRFVLFGDSLSDPGNDYVLFGQTVKAPFAPIPEWPYSIGGHHFSNGMTWSEQLANAMGSPNSGAPATQNRLFTNYAFGGARARPGGPFPSIDLTTQVGLFTANFKQACSDATYIIWIGGDDLRDALLTLQIDPSGAGAIPIISAAVESIANNLALLASIGAHKFLVFDVPDVSKAPFVMAQPPAVQAAAAFFSQQFNLALGSALQQLQGFGLNITRFDPNPLIAAIEENPAAFGFVNGTTPCLTFGVIPHALCQTPSQFFFWDGIHPTTAGHKVLADVVKTDIFP